jgi:hypothetical protein
MELPMKRFVSYFVLSASVLATMFAPAPLFPQVIPSAMIDGIWQGFATVNGAVQVPVTIRISGTRANLQAAFLNGPAAQPDTTPASSVAFDGSHLVVSFDYFARKFDAELSRPHIDRYVWACSYFQLIEGWNPDLRHPYSCCAAN